MESRDDGVVSCDAIDMKIMDPDDALGSFPILISLVNNLRPNSPGAKAWLGGGLPGSCSSLSWISPGNFQRQSDLCSNLRGTICEFNGK